MTSSPAYVHGGSVWAEGRPGQGASFCISLRAARAD